MEKRARYGDALRRVAAVVTIYSWGSRFSLLVRVKAVGETNLTSNKHLQGALGFAWYLKAHQVMRFSFSISC